MPSLRGGDRMPHACFNLHASSQLQSSADNVSCLAVTVPALRTQSQSFILIYFPRSTQHSVFAAFRKSSTDCGSTSSGSLMELKHRTCSEKSRSRSAGSQTGEVVRDKQSASPFPARLLATASWNTWGKAMLALDLQTNILQLCHRARCFPASQLCGMSDLDGVELAQERRSSTGHHPSTRA